MQIWIILLIINEYKVKPLWYHTHDNKFSKWEDKNNDESGKLKF